MNVPAQELESYTFVADTSLTLVCKPLRAILEFGDACDVGVSLRYAEGGKPVIVQLHDEGLFVARCVFATRVTEDAPAPAVDGAAVVTGVGRRKGRLQTQAETPGMQLDATHGRTQGRSQGRTQGHTQGHARTQSERQPTSSPLASHVYEESPSSYGQPVRQTDRYAGRDYLQVAHEADDDERNPYGDSGDMEDDDDDDDFVEGTPPPAS